LNRSFYVVLKTSYADKTFLPFLLLLERTARPALVAMRARKP